MIGETGTLSFEPCGSVLLSAAPGEGASAVLAILAIAAADARAVPRTRAILVIGSPRTVVPGAPEVEAEADVARAAELARIADTVSRPVPRVHVTDILLAGACDPISATRFHQNDGDRVLAVEPTGVRGAQLLLNFLGLPVRSADLGVDPLAGLPADYALGRALLVVRIVFPVILGFLIRTQRAERSVGEAELIDDRGLHGRCGSDKLLLRHLPLDRRGVEDEVVAVVLFAEPARLDLPVAVRIGLATKEVHLAGRGRRGKVAGARARHIAGLPDLLVVPGVGSVIARQCLASAEDADSRNN